jgi:DNA-directed RNA polymerase specialized sigma subunit
VNYGISRLDGREGDIFSRYFFEGYTMEEIGVVHRTSKSNVCRIVHKIKCKFRKRVC